MSALYPTRDRQFTKATERRLQDDARKHVYGASETSLLVQHSYPELLNYNSSNNNNSNNYQQSHSSKGSPSHHNNQHVWTSIGIKKYQIIKKVGSGTYGWVFHAKSPQGTYDVAIKQLSPMQNEKTLQDGFHITAIREIKILKSLQHTNIISLHDVICDKENVMDSMDDSNRKKDKAHKNIPSRMQTYMIFEYMHHDLSGLLHNDAFTSTFNIRHIKYFLCQILNALEYCHETALILHRDIKSSNLLVDNHGVVKIADFGLARQFIPELSTSCKKIAVRHESINRSSVQYPRQYTNRVVTLWYRAPELLLSDQHYTPSVDLWSVGCVFAEMLFNKPIFCGKNELEQWFQIIEACGWDQKQEQKWISHLRDKDGLVNAMKKKSKIFNRKLKKKFTQFLRNDPSNTKYLDENGFNLLDSLLTINPFKRCSAKRARLNEWFKSSPFPQPPQLSHIAPSHDYEQRQARKNPNYKKSQNGYNSQSNNQRRYQYNPYGNGNNGGYGNRNNNNRYNNNNNTYNNNYNNNNNKNNYRRNSMGNNNNSNDKSGGRSRSRSRSRERGGSNAKSMRNKPVIDDRSRSGSFDKGKKDNSNSLPPPLAFKPPIATKPNNGKMVVTLTAPTMNRPTTIINVPKPQNGINSINKIPSYNNTQNGNGYKKPYIQYQKPFDPNEPTTFYSRHKRPDELKGRSRF